MERDYKQEIEDIENHLENLCGRYIIGHASIDRQHHTLPFQIFRMLSGYNEALYRLHEDEIFTNAQFVILYKDGEYSAQAKSPDGEVPGAVAFGASAQEALSNVIRKIATTETR